MSDVREEVRVETDRVPIVATLLGAAGLLPLILSFLGGIWWGVAATRATPEQMPKLMGVAVVPSLIAWLVVAMAWNFPATASTTLGVTITLTPLVDRWLAQRGLVPAWWMKFRLPLSLALGALVLGLGFSLA